ncbi:MAG: hypothetical protein QMD50_01770 [Patescibacteria group bacterium]|nr:hypothetical protein [Patescibacteria group bacterium]
MREERLIKKGSLCDTDYTDKAIQSVSNAEKKGRVFCPNLEQCKNRSATEDIQCYRRVAQEMVGFILDRKSPFEQAIKEERNEYLIDAPDGKFWVCRNGEWQVVQGKKNAVQDIVDFAIVIIDRQPNERRPFTEDGMRIPELGPSDAMSNAMLDFDDMHAEVGQKNPFK